MYIAKLSPNVNFHIAHKPQNRNHSEKKCFSRDTVPPEIKTYM